MFSTQGAAASGCKSISSDVWRNSYQHPAPGAPSVCPAYYDRIIYFLNDGDEIITFQLWEERDGKKRKRGQKAENEAEARGRKIHRLGLKMQTDRERREGRNHGECVKKWLERQRQHRERERERPGDGQTNKRERGGRWNGGMKNQSKSRTQSRLGGERAACSERAI